MSKSIHTTIKDLKGLTKSEIDQQLDNPDSDLAALAKKSSIKKQVLDDRKNHKQDN